MKRAVVLGLMGQYPFAGMAWQVIHHVLGFERLGVRCRGLLDSCAATKQDRDRRCCPSSCHRPDTSTCKAVHGRS